MLGSDERNSDAAAGVHQRPLIGVIQGVNLCGKSRRGIEWGQVDCKRSQKRHEASAPAGCDNCDNSRCAGQDQETRQRAAMPIDRRRAGIRAGNGVQNLTG